MSVSRNTYSKLVEIEADISIVDGLHDVPPVDDTNNVNLRDVEGNKDDTHSGTSAMAITKRLNEHVHSAQFVYPFRAPMGTLISDPGPWAVFPTPTEIIPANTITADFDIHWAIVSNLSSNEGFDMELYSGAAGFEVKIAEFGSVRSAVQSSEGSVPVQTEIQLANTRISAALSTSGASSQNLRIKLLGHTY